VTLCFGGSKLVVRGYVGSKFRGYLGKMRSIIGYVFILSGCTISWLSKLKNVVALFTTKVKHMVITKDARKLYILIQMPNGPLLQRSDAAQAVKKLKIEQMDEDEDGEMEM